MEWEGNRKRLLHGADGTNLYSGGGIPNDTHSRYDTEGRVDGGSVLQTHDSSLLARGNLCIGVLHRKDRQYLC